jgi:uncharacterized repeat protein (TIGR03943 family)
VNKQAQAVVLLLFGGAILKAAVTDIHLRYVKEALQPFLVAAGLLLVAAAVMTLWYDLRAPRPDHADDGHGHGHAHHEPRVGWLLILPVLGLLLVAPPALGSYAAGQAGTVLTAENSASDYPPLPPGDPAPVSLLDYASRAVFDEGRSLTGRTLTLTGFVAPGPDGQPMLARMVMSCCAADGRPIKVGLSGDTPISVPADTWVRVVGVYTGRTGQDPINQATVPYLEVRSWQQVEQPKQPYE